MKSQAMIRSIVILLSLTWGLSSVAQEVLMVAGCAEADFVDGQIDNEISISGMSYTPKCLRVRIGASVSIQASRRHPLEAMPDINGAINPFNLGQPSSVSITKIMSEPGLYGYYCVRHGDEEGDGMAGVIQVVL